VKKKKRSERTVLNGGGIIADRMQQVAAFTGRVRRQAERASAQEQRNSKSRKYRPAPPQFAPPRRVSLFPVIFHQCPIFF
jgi:hypothetical protein